MKTLSILLLLAATTALGLGALLAVTPASADVSGTTDVGIITALVKGDAQGPITLNTGLENGQSDGSESALVLESASESLETLSANSDAGINNVFSANVEKAAITESSTTEIQGEQAASNVESLAIVDTLESFAESVTNGRKNQLRGLYAENILALRINRQPKDDPTFVTDNVGEITQFAMASEYGSRGLIAHNYLSGSDFYDLSEGQTINLVFGDGRTKAFRIERIRSFQALSPGSVYSEFIDLDFGGNLSASELFHSMYNSDNPLVLQTCIGQDGISTWGRVFIIAVPLTS